MRRFLITFGIMFSILFFSFIFQPLLSLDNRGFTYEQKFEQVLNNIERNYIEDTDKGKLVEDAVKGMLKELDPHSVYISAEDMKSVKEDFQGSFEGIGVQFDIIEDTITIVHPIPGGPSDKLGIIAGDKIVTIDSVDAVGIERAEVPKKLKGPKGTVVIVEIKRWGSPDLLRYEITRDKIPLNSVDASFIKDGTDIGIIKVNRFSATTHRELLTALRQMKRQGMKKLVLDLRSNPGGYLNQAFQMANDFLPYGDTIVYTMGRRPEFTEYFLSEGSGDYEKIPLIVMLNRSSASASEIVAGAVQDLDRGLVVGETSFGKGVVQRQYSLPDGSAYRLTISKYYTPSGRCIQRPMEDEKKYRKLVGRFELDEGSYLENTYAKIKKQVEKHNEEIEDEENRINLDSLPLYYTKTGRIVFGGGGITPDIIINQDTITDMSVHIRRKNLFFQYVNIYMKEHGMEVKREYEHDFKNFLRTFDITPEMIADFKTIVEAAEVEWSEEDYSVDEDFIKTSIKSNIAKDIWGQERATEVFLTIDNQFNRALEHFPDALKISQLR